MVTPVGFEPTTSWFEAKRSIQMSYGALSHIKVDIHTNNLKITLKL